MFDTDRLTDRSVLHRHTYENQRSTQTEDQSNAFHIDRQSDQSVPHRHTNGLCVPHGQTDSFVSFCYKSDFHNDGCSSAPYATILIVYGRNHHFPGWELAADIIKLFPLRH